MEKGEGPPRVRLELSWKTILKVLLAVALAYAAVLLWPLVKLLSISILLAVALYPLVTWACRKGWPRWAGLLLAISTLLVALVGVFGLIGPIAYRQTARLAENLPRLQQQVRERISASPFGDRMIQGAMTSGPLGNPEAILKRGLDLGKTTIRGVFDLVLMIVFAIYFMVDGPRALRWGVVFFPDEQRPKINAAMEEGADLVFAYVVGQFITSALCAGYVFLILSILHVPMALLLAVAAGVFDILPIVGFFLSVLPAMAMGLTVSVKTALLILVLYGVYHLFENYFVVPKVYGDKLRLSTLVVLLAITVAGVLAGVTGAIIVLPLVAAYPVFERLWLAPQLPPDAIAEHQSGDTTTPPCA